MVDDCFTKWQMIVSPKDYITLIVKNNRPIVLSLFLMLLQVKDLWCHTCLSVWPMLKGKTYSTSNKNQRPEKDTAYMIYS